MAKKMAKKSLLTMALLVLITLMTVSAWSEVPSSINFQGKLTDSGGNPLTGSYNMTFYLFTLPSGGGAIWSENHPSVQVTDGIYSVQLGGLTPSLFLNDNVYLEVEIEGETIAPRQQLTSTAFTMKAALADSVIDGAVTTVMIADSAVDTQKVADSAITSGKVADRAITAEKVADSAITSIQIADGAVTAADILDGPGSGLDADTLDGLDSTAFGDITGVTAGTGLTGGGTSGTVALDVVTPLSLTDSVYTAGVISGYNNDSTYGYGVYGEASGSNGRGVFGYATNTGDVANYGGFFSALGTSGRGVSGYATGTNSVGVQATSSGSNGRGVFGSALDTGDVTNYGGYFSASGTSGRGVFGVATGSAGYGVWGLASSSGGVENYGGYFSATGTSGRGVYGEASNTGDYENYGGYFSASGKSGRGVYGEASNTAPGINYGGYFTAAGTIGRGVYAEAPGISGIGIVGAATFTGDYQNIGVYGEAAGSDGVGVRGTASNTGDVANVGGYFLANGTSGKGVIGFAYYSSGIGVYGFGGAYDFYAAGPGTNYAPFTGAHEVRFAQDVPEDIQPGMIVSVTGRAEKRKKDNGEISLSSTLPTVTVTEKAKDKAVLGVLVAEEPLPEDHWYRAQEQERFGAVNALGEGRMLVTNTNGDIEAGDYITSSDIPGYGQRQDDDLVHSYTVGKAIETVEWDEVTDTIEYQGRQMKIYLIAVVYTSG